MLKKTATYKHAHIYLRWNLLNSTVGSEKDNVLALLSHCKTIFVKLKQYVKKWFHDFKVTVGHPRLVIM